MLDIGRAFREEGHLYDPSWQRPHVARPLVPRYLRRTVRERIRSDGSVLYALDEDELRVVVDRLRGEEVEIIAVCFINSYTNPVHERRAREVINEHWPEVRVELSSDIAPVPREYDRGITLALNSYVSPVVRTYLGEIDSEIRGRGFERDLYVMQSHGGLMEATLTRDAPIGTMMSGPVAGVLGAKYLSEMIDVPNMLTFDMGGTSTDVACITGGEFAYSKRYQIEWDIYSILPMVEINSVGQGGGSIAWHDTAGALRVGPQSAGALPGPACYGKGGVEPTITDSNAVRGLLQEDTFVGGQEHLDRSAAEKSIRALMNGKDGDVRELARGIYDIANANMMEAIRGVTIYKGIDPREYALLSYGSAGGQHISTIAGELQIENVVIPPHPGTFSAFGLICSDLKVDQTAAVVQHMDKLTNEELTETFARLERSAVELLEKQGIPKAEIVGERFIEGHYLGQTWETVARAPLGEFDDAKRAELVGEFHRTHERLWAFRADDLPLVVLNARVSVLGPTEKPSVPRLAESSNADPGEAHMFAREIHLAAEDSRQVPFYARDRLRPGHVIEGPAAIVETTSTTMLFEGDVCGVDVYGNLRIKKERR
jgi:N-methylhydantoinase A